VEPYEIRLQSEAVAEFQALSPGIRDRVREKLLWLGEHAEEVRHLPLRKDLAGLYKRRVGDYRIIYQIIKEARIITIQKIGHRREIYDTS
jgi:mRNA interferase RelE/StbE